MNNGRGFDDGELEQLFGTDAELLRVARLLSATHTPEPPLDPSFQSALRRQLLKEAWAAREPRRSFVGRFFRGPGLAWAAATVGVLMIAFVAFDMVTNQSRNQGSTIYAHPVANNQAIQIDFGQPMDHASVESSLKIHPATSVSYEWRGNTLIVHPRSGPLADNTQYQVILPDTTKKADGSTITRAATFTFVTQPPATPTPSVSPTPSPGWQIANQRQLAQVASGTFIAWRGGTIYFIGAGGDLRAVGADGQNERSLGVTGVTSAQFVDGARPEIAYVNTAGIGVVAAAGGAATQVDSGSSLAFAYQPIPVPSATPSSTSTPGPNPQLVPAAGLAYVQDVHVYEIAPDGTRVLLRTLAQTPVVAFFDGAAVVYRDGTGQVHVAPLGSTAPETNWSHPVNGPFVIGPKGGIVFAGTDGVYAADQGGASTKIVGYDALKVGSGDKLAFATHAPDLLLISTGSSLYSVRTDGTQLMKLQDGEFSSPTWSPDANAIAYQRQGALWSASVELPNGAPSVQDGYATVDGFMKRRIAGNTDAASAYLDANGAAAFRASGANLVISSPLALHRYFIVLSQTLPGRPTSLRYVVRLLLSDKSNVELQQFDETLTLQPGPQGKLLVHDVKVGQPFDAVKGAQVLLVDAAPASVKVTFDSDLNADTVPNAFTVSDATGAAVNAQVSYQARVVTITFANPLRAGATYHLNVATSLQDISNQPLGAAYPIDFVAAASS